MPLRTWAGETLSLTGSALKRSVRSSHNPCEAYCGAKTTSDANRSGNDLAPAAEASFAGYSSFGYAVTSTLFLCVALYFSAKAFDTASVAARVHRVMVAPESAPAVFAAGVSPPHAADKVTKVTATMPLNQRLKTVLLIYGDEGAE